MRMLSAAVLATALALSVSVAPAVATDSNDATFSIRDPSTGCSHYFIVIIEARWPHFSHYVSCP